jgi:hypothetical protein
MYSIEFLYIYNIHIYNIILMKIKNLVYTIYIFIDFTQILNFNTK